MRLPAKSRARFKSVGHRDVWKYLPLKFSMPRIAGSDAEADTAEEEEVMYWLLPWSTNVRLWAPSSQRADLTVLLK